MYNICYDITDMISQLTIQNFGLIDRLSMEFCENLNIFTGETGAGKSILIGAVRFALGERLNSSQIRDNSQACIVEAVFELSKRYLEEYPLFSEYIPDGESSLIINRTVFPDGRNRIKLNGFNLTVSQLKELGDHLVDLHGPNDHQMLLSSDSHIGILDRLCDMDDIKKTYLEKFREYSDLVNQKDELERLAGSRELDLEFLAHQIKELEQVPLSSEKHEEFLQKQSRIDNAEKLFETVNQLIDYFENDQYGISETVSKAFAPMERLKETDEATGEYLEMLENLQVTGSELLSSLKEYAARLSYEPEESAETARICDIYYEIKRKYGPTLEAARSFYEDAKKKYELLLDYEHNDTDLQKKITAIQKELLKTAEKITKKRKKTASLLKETIENELKELGIKHVLFDCRIEKTEITRNGADSVTFYISPNAGEELKPMADIVSSGEASRLMLALKKALTKVDPIPVLIFDEIDSHIGGRLGTITGKKLKELSSDRQVILITHLPQIASFGDKHFRIEKTVKDNHTFTKAILLDKDSRVKELAKMMSGEKESGIAVKHAEDMLAQAASLDA